MEGKGGLREWERRQEDGGVRVSGKEKRWKVGERRWNALMVQKRAVDGGMETDVRGARQRGAGRGEKAGEKTSCIPQTENWKNEERR